MNNPLVRESIEFKKCANDQELRCTMHVCQDGSVYIDGDEIEIGFEERATALEEATNYLMTRGYSKCQ